MGEMTGIDRRQPLFRTILLPLGLIPIIVTEQMIRRVLQVLARVGKVMGMTR